LLGKGIRLGLGREGKEVEKVEWERNKAVREGSKVEMEGNAVERGKV